MAYQPSLLISYSVLYYGLWRHATLVYPLSIPCLSLAYPLLKGGGESGEFEYLF